MTVQELIEELKILPDDLKVVVRGYENGFNDVIELKMHRLVLTENAEWWDGRYQQDDHPDSIKAVEIFGENGIPNS